MTKTTVKKGMLTYKSGYGKDDFDYNFIEEMAYNEKILVKHLVHKLNDADEKNEKAITKLNDELVETNKINQALRDELDTLKETVNQLLTVNLGG